MRHTMLVGLSLAVAAFAAVLVSAASDLQIEPLALAGVAVGAVVALVPDRTPGARLAGLLVGMSAAWVGFVARAAMLPDSATGKATVVALVILLATALTVVARRALTLWAVLLGAGVFAGVYEARYAAAPPEVATTSMTTLTALVAAVAVGFLATVVAAPTTRVALTPVDEAADTPALDEPTLVPVQREIDAAGDDTLSLLNPRTSGDEAGKTLENAR